MMAQTILHANPYRPFALRLACGFAVASLLLLPPALWFGPVSLTYLGASALLGFLFTGLTLIYWKYQTHPWGRLLFVLAVAVVVAGSSWLRTSMVSLPLAIRYPWWLSIQYLATMLLVFSSVVFLEERVATWPRGIAALILLLTIGAIAWYRAEQSRPLLYPNATDVIVEDDAPPGARKVSFTTTAEPQAILMFYRRQLEH